MESETDPDMALPKSHEEYVMEDENDGPNVDLYHVGTEDGEHNVWFHSFLSAVRYTVDNCPPDEDPDEKFLMTQHTLNTKEVALLLNVGTENYTAPFEALH